ncbi:MAG: DUF4880 domain-containing protein [Bacteroidota bacterium]
MRIAMEERILILIQKFLEADMSPTERAELEAWAQASPENRKALEEYQQLASLLSQHAPQLGATFSARTWERWQADQLEEQEIPLDLWFAFTRVGLPALAACVLALFFIYLSEPGLDWSGLIGFSELSMDELVEKSFEASTYE